MEDNAKVRKLWVRTSAMQFHELGLVYDSSDSSEDESDAAGVVSGSKTPERLESPSDEHSPAACRRQSIPSSPTPQKTAGVKRLASPELASPIKRSRIKSLSESVSSHQADTEQRSGETAIDSAFASDGERQHGPVQRDACVDGSKYNLSSQGLRIAIDALKSSGRDGSCFVPPQLRLGRPNVPTEDLSAYGYQRQGRMKD